MRAPVRLSPSFAGCWSQCHRYLPPVLLRNCLADQRCVGVWVYLLSPSGYESARLTRWEGVDAHLLFLQLLLPRHHVCHYNCHHDGLLVRAR